MANLYEDLSDIRFHMEHCTDWDNIVPLVERDFADAEEYKKNQDSRFEFAPTNVDEAVEGYTMAWQAIGEIISEELIPHVQKLDVEGAVLKDGKVTFPQEMVNFVNTLREAGLLSYSHQRKYGGYNMGLSARMPINEMLYGADVGTGIVVGYYNMAEVIEFFADDELKAKYLPRFGAGEILGAMALTEPNYGSDLSQIQTKAVQNDDGTWSITGTKRFITQGCGFGDHPAAIFTIARSKDAKGAKGISFFLVETEEVSVERLEDKIGLHSSATCEIVYDNSKGYLIGEEGYGLVRYAIALMNGARVGIACQSLGSAQRALTLAKKYASERVQFNVEIEKLPAVARLLNESEARVQAARAIVYRTSQIVDMHQGLTQKLERTGADEKAIRKNEEVAKWDRLAKLMTPTSKLTASEFAIRVAYDSLQAHGGVGYTEEFEIAKVYRDARISTIYEGTSQLQTVAIIGGVVEGVSDTSFISAYVQEELAKIKDAGVVAQVQRHWDTLKESVVKYKELGRDEKAHAAWDIAWHWCYVITQILMGQHMTIIKEKGLSEFEAGKAQALATYLQIADREVAACITQVNNMAQAAQGAAKQAAAV